MDLSDSLAGDAVFGKHLSGTLCGIDLKSEVIEHLCGLRYFLLIGISYGYENSALDVELIACCGQSFIE